MFEPPRFRAYCKQLWTEYLRKESLPWARDQIGWPVMVVVLTPLVAAFILKRQLDWPLVWTSLWIYIAAFVIYWLSHFIRAAWRLHQKQASDIATLTEGLETRSQMYVQAQTENVKNLNSCVEIKKQLISTLDQLVKAKAEAANNSDAFHSEMAKNSQLNEDIRALTWPEDRPKLSFHAWGQRQPHFMPALNSDPVLMAQYGFYLVNDGGAALDVTVESFKVTEKFIAIGGTISRIEGKSDGFVPVWIKDEVPLSRWALDIALEQAWEEKGNLKEVFGSVPLEFPVSVVYKDYNQLWYRSRGTLKFFYDSFHANRIEFTAIEQDRLGTVRPTVRIL